MNKEFSLGTLDDVDSRFEGKTLKLDTLSPYRFEKYFRDEQFA
jgi:hypothetical protein